MLQGLRAIAKDSEGYVGAMIGVIEKVRSDASSPASIPATAWLKAIEEEKVHLERQKKRTAEAQSNIVAFKRGNRRRAA